MRPALPLAVLAVLAFWTQPPEASAGPRPQPMQEVSAGVRWFAANDEFEPVPYDDGDQGYSIAYHFITPSAYWQLATTLAPEAGADPEVDSVVTPEFNIVLYDRFVQLGTGVLISHVDYEHRGSDWSDVYWQLLGGFHVPLGGLNLSALAYYRFEELSDVGDLALDDMDVGLWLGYQF